MTAGNKAYNAQRTATRAADEEHAKMLQWYADKLEYSSVSSFRASMSSINSDVMKRLYKEYQELK